MANRTAPRSRRTRTRAAAPSWPSSAVVGGSSHRRGHLTAAPGRGRRAVPVRHRRPGRHRAVHRARGGGGRAQRHEDRPDPVLRPAAVRGVRPRGGHPRRGRRVRRVHPDRAGQRRDLPLQHPGQLQRHRAGTPRIDLRANGSAAQDRPGHLEVRLVLRRLPVQQQPGRHQPAPLLRRGPDHVRLDPAGRHEDPAPGQLDRAVADVHHRPGRLRERGRRAIGKPTNAIDVVADFGADPTRRRPTPRPSSRPRSTPARRRAGRSTSRRATTRSTTTSSSTA